MQKLIKLFDEKLEYISHELVVDKIHIHVRSAMETSVCPYCGKPSSGIHSRTYRVLKDLPIQGKKVLLQLESRKYFWRTPTATIRPSPNTSHFFESKATMTLRLRDEIMRVSLTQSSIAASKYLRNSVADVGKSTICNLLKKGLSTGCG